MKRNSSRHDPTYSLRVSQLTMERGSRRSSQDHADGQINCISFKCAFSARAATHWSDSPWRLMFCEEQRSILAPIRNRRKYRNVLCVLIWSKNGSTGHVCLRGNGKPLFGSFKTGIHCQQIGGNLINYDQMSQKLEDCDRRPQSDLGNISGWLSTWSGS